MLELSNISLQTPWGEHTDPGAILLQLEESSDARSLALVRAMRSIVDAQELVLNRRLEEISTLRQPTHLGDEAVSVECRMYHQAHQTLLQARASRETLLAERKLAAKHIKDAKLRLQASYQAAEVVETKIMLAEQRLGGIMAEMTALGMMIPFSHRPASAPRPSLPLDFWLDDSDSEGSSADMDVLKALESDEDNVDERGGDNVNNEGIDVNVDVDIDPGAGLGDDV